MDTTKGRQMSKINHVHLSNMLEELAEALLRWQNYKTALTNQELEDKMQWARLLGHNMYTYICERQRFQKRILLLFRLQQKLLKSWVVQNLLLLFSSFFFFCHFLWRTTIEHDDLLPMGVWPLFERQNIAKHDQNKLQNEGKKKKCNDNIYHTKRGQSTLRKIWWWRRQLLIRELPILDNPCHP